MITFILLESNCLAITTKLLQIRCGCLKSIHLSNLVQGVSLFNHLASIGAAI